MQAVAEGSTIVCRNPADGAELARLEATEPAAIAAIVRDLRPVTNVWDGSSWEHRRSFLKAWRAELSRRAGELADAVAAEVGKPRVEAMAAEVVPTLDLIAWTIRHAPKALRPESVGSAWQVPIRGSARRWWRPLGVVGILGAWNYPILLNAPLIANAVAVSNGVVWKPSELSARTGELLQDTMRSVGLDHWVRIVQGGPEVGRALAESGIDKAWYTGGIGGGRAVLEALGRRGVPAVAELSGFDPAIVLPDAPIEPTARALAWSAFVGCGQTCTAVKRVYVVGDDGPMARALADQARSLRVGDPMRPTTDIGPMISEAARSRFHEQVRGAVAAGAEVLAGAEPIDGPGWFYRPTVLRSTDDAPEKPLEGCFGPIVIVRGMTQAWSAVQAANASRYALSASVWGRDRRMARSLHDMLDAPVVGINEAVTFFAHPSTPIGGRKASGFGRVHGVEGLREFAQPAVTVERPLGTWRPQLFPYSDRFARLIETYRRLHHRG